MPPIGRLERVALREVWPHEALDFTQWLEENADALADVLDFTPSNIERERAAGSFSVDLVAEDDDGRAVVIENQLERSDHDHLGKLITYLTAFDAARAVWIVAQPRPEHVSAIAWLNE
jgi:RecB family endonuclease NucS